MKQDMSSMSYREYATMFSHYSQEYESYICRMEALRDFLIRSSVDSHMAYTVHWEELVNLIEKNIYEMRDTCQKIQECEHEMLRMAERMQCLSPPLIDFISSIDIKEWWAQAYPIIEQIATVTGAITGVATIAVTPAAFVKWVRNKLQAQKKNKEYNWIQYILSKDEWNISILCQKLELTDTEAKKLLKGFGYVWDAKKMLYIATENTHKLRDIEIDNRNNRPLY